jgi:hypothetical protein
MKKYLLVALLMTTSSAYVLPAQAGYNHCNGTINVGKEWTTIISKDGDGMYSEFGCRFLTNSKVGRQDLGDLS